MDVIDLVFNQGFIEYNSQYFNKKCLGDLEYILKVGNWSICQTSSISNSKYEKIKIGLTKEIDNAYHVSIYYYNRDLLNHQKENNDFIEIGLLTKVGLNGLKQSDFNFLNRFDFYQTGLPLRIDEFNQVFSVYKEKQILIKNGQLLLNFHGNITNLNISEAYNCIPECYHGKVRDYSFKMSLSFKQIQSEFKITKQAFNKTLDSILTNKYICSKQYEKLGFTRPEALKIYKILKFNKLVDAPAWNDLIKKRCLKYEPYNLNLTFQDFSKEMNFAETLLYYTNQRTYNKRKHYNFLEDRLLVSKSKKRNLILFEEIHVINKKAPYIWATFDQSNLDVYTNFKRVLKELTNNTPELKEIRRMTLEDKNIYTKEEVNNFEMMKHDQNALDVQEELERLRLIKVEKRRIRRKNRQIEYERIRAERDRRYYMEVQKRYFKMVDFTPINIKTAKIRLEHYMFYRPKTMFELYLNRSKKVLEKFILKHVEKVCQLTLRWRVSRTPSKRFLPIKRRLRFMAEIKFHNKRYKKTEVKKVLEEPKEIVEEQEIYTGEEDDRVRVRFNKPNKLPEAEQLTRRVKKSGILLNNHFYKIYGSTWPENTAEFNMNQVVQHMLNLGLKIEDFNFSALERKFAKVSKK